MIVHDNFLNDLEVVNKIYNHILFDCSHKFGEVSNSASGCDGFNPTNTFYYIDFSLDDNLLKFLHDRFFDLLDANPDDYYADRINANIQYYGMGIDSDFHQDGGEFTFTALYMISPNIEGGEFVYIDDDKIKKIPYKQDRLIVFDNPMLHKANPPTNLSSRITIAFKMYSKKCTQKI